jgi:UDP-glucose 4-epimerase
MISTGDLENLRAVRDDPKLRFIHSRVSDWADLNAVVSSAESIYHLAAAVGVELVLRSPLRSIQTNLHETEAILRRPAAIGCRSC